METKYIWPNLATIIGLWWSLYNCILMSRGDVSGLYMSVISSHLDFVDGTLARYLDACSEFGNFLDKTADKIRHAAQAYVCIIIFHSLPDWIFWALLMRDIIIDVLRYTLISLRYFFHINIPFMHSSSYLAKVKTYILPYGLLLSLLGTDALVIPFISDNTTLKSIIGGIGVSLSYVTVFISYYTLFLFLITINDKRYINGKKSVSMEKID